MKRILFLICTLLCLHGISNAQNCAAAFSAGTSPTSLTVSFHDSSIVTNGGHVGRWYWVFGDNSNSSTDQNPTHTYAAAGTYYVCLYISDTLNGVPCTSSHCDSVRVGVTTPPSCAIGYQYTTGPNNGQINFTSSAAVPAGTTAAYTWSFGDGTSGTGANPVHVYTQSGAYQACVELVLSNNAGVAVCNAHFCDSVHITLPALTCAANYGYTANGLALTFHDSSTTAGGTPLHTNWYWSFGDNTTSSLQNPSHTFAAAGTYYVCETVRDSSASGLCYNTKCDSIHLAAPCTAYFTLPTITGLSAAFSGQYSTSTGTGTTIYEWNFGDSTSGSGLNITHAYTHSGTFNVCLTIVNTATGCNNTFCRSVTIPSTNIACQAGFTATQSTSVALTEAFSNTSTHTTGVPNVTFAWTFGDGTSSSITQPTHTYSASGTYYVCLTETVRDSLQNVTCTSQHCDSVHVVASALSCYARYNYSASGLTVAFRDSSYTVGGTPLHTTWYWTFGDGTTGSGQTPSHTYTAAGTYYVCETVRDSSSAGLCYNQHCDSIRVAAPTTCTAYFTLPTVTGLSAAFSGQYSTSTANNTTYSWTFGDSTSGSGLNVTHAYSHSGTYNVCLTISTPGLNGGIACTNTFCRSVTIPSTTTSCQAAFTATQSTSVALTEAFTNTSTHATGAPSVTFAWTFGDGTSSSSTAPTHTYSAAGTYYVCLTETVRDSVQNVTCTSQHCDSVHVTTSALSCYARYTYTATGLGVAFRDSSYTVGGTPLHTTWYWSFGDGTTGTGQDPTHTYSAAGTYYVCETVRDSSSAGLCYNQHCDSIHVTAAQVSCQAYFTAPVITGTTAAFSSQYSTGTNSATTYEWTFGDSTSATGASASHTYAAAGTYNVCLTISTPANVPGAAPCVSHFCRTVSITANPPSCSVTAVHSVNGLYAGFVATATGHNITYNWYFGDNTSTGYGASYSTTNHLYTAAGTYYACVYIQSHDSAGNVICTAHACDSIHVSPGSTTTCGVQYAYTTGPNVGQVNFTASGTGNNLTYGWSFGDGTTGSGQNPTHVYSRSGAYQACVSIEAHDSAGNVYCTAHFCDSIHVAATTVNCGVGFQYVQTPNGNTVNFTASATGHNITYNWYFGDNTGTGYGAYATTSHTYAAAGHYFVCVYIESHDSAGNVTCTAHYCDSVRVSPSTIANPCHASFSAIASTASGSSGIYFSNSSTGGSNTTQTYYTWTFGDSTSSHLTNPFHTYANPGTYHVCLTMTTYGPTSSTIICSDDTCMNVTVVAPNPVPCQSAFQYTATNNPNELHFQQYATGSNLTYSWDFGDGHSATTGDPVHAYSAPGYYNVCLTVTDAVGGAILCTATHCDTILIGSPTVTQCQAGFHYILSTSIGNGVHFVNTSTGGNHLTFLWTFGDGDSSTNYDPNHTYAHAGTYWVCLTIKDVNPAGLITCTSQLCDSVVIGGPNVNPTNPGPFTLTGTVYNGTRFASVDAIVYLITLDSFNLIAVDSVLAPQGLYAFANVPAGHYLVKGALRPTAPDFTHYVPTYYGDVLFWLNATLLNVNQNIASVDIHLQPGVNNGGPGFVGGNIFQGANKVGDPLTGYQVMVLNMDNTPVQYMYSDGSGKFNFSNLAYGTYQLYTEVLGIPTYPAIFTISPATELGNVNVLVNTDSVTFEKLTGIETVGSNITGTSLFPNPVSSSAVVRFDAATDGTVSITLTNMVGQQMMEHTMNVVAGSNDYTINMSSMASGIYILNIKDSNSKGAIFKIVKE